jgi:hypothetical protein
MDRFYKFAVLQASPDDKRDERVNVGIVVATPKGLDIRHPELRKLRDLTGHNWDSIAGAYFKQLDGIWKEQNDLARLADTPSGMSEVFALGDVRTLRANESDYEDRIKSILSTLVDRPVLSRKEKQERINTEIAKVLKRAGVLGEKGDAIETQRVIPKFVVSEEKDIVADFAYAGSERLKIVSTLDLRGERGAHGKACEKGATLYFAEERYGDRTLTMGVYAASPPERETHKGEIEILNSFAHGNTFNWMDAAERQRFQHALY